MDAENVTARKAKPGFFARARKRMRGRWTAGSAAIEFAFVAPPFFLLLMGTIETGVIFFAQTTLQYATEEAARLVRTGQAQAASMTQAQFRQKVCDNISTFMSCGTNLIVDVRNFADFNALTYPSALNGDNTLNQGVNNYSPGGAGDVVLVRVFYQWSVSTPLLNTALSNMASNSHLLAAAATFRNEPF
jgi:Flp pilus assembly protein TadG